MTTPDFDLLEASKESDIFDKQKGSTVEGEADAEASIAKATSEDDNYMELYVDKELKEKFDPL